MRPVEPTFEDLDQAHAVLSRRGVTPQPADVEALALGLAARRLAGVEDGISDGDLRAAHDALCVSGARNSLPGLLESLAAALLARGIVPQPWEHDATWWLWLPTKGRGPCQRCGQVRSLTRYSNMFGRPYRYLCGRCRKDERAEDTADLDRATGVTRQPGESPMSLLMRRLAALAEQHTAPRPTANGTPPGPQTSGAAPARTQPTDDEWGEHVDRLVQLLGPLEWAGWQVPDAYDSDVDAAYGPHLYGSLWRTWMVIDIEYDPSGGELRLQPYTDVTGEDEPAFSMLDDTVTITLTGNIDQDVRAVAATAGELGLLDAIRLRHSDGSDRLATLMTLAYRQWILGPAQAHRQISASELAEQLDADAFFSTFFRFVAGFVAPDVLPDLVPDAAALGVVAWCWRNNTAVEDWHLPSDVLMARASIAATKAVQPHVDPYEGVDWDAVRQALTDPGLRLPGGAVVADLFGAGWAEVVRTVTEQIHTWQRLDEDLLGPEATLRLLTIAGSTSYTRHWWGQGRWPAICRRIVTDAVTVGVDLPPPYDTRGADQLIANLADPDHVSDNVLDWLIDIPDGDTPGPRGLRLHTDAAKPVYRTITDA
jgi:hypothetical protein